MCRAVVESEVGGNTAEGITNGIVYLMAIPYILVGGLFYFVYKKLRNSRIFKVLTLMMHSYKV